MNTQERQRFVANVQEQNPNQFTFDFESLSWGGTLWHITRTLTAADGTQHVEYRDMSSGETEDYARFHDRFWTVVLKGAQFDVGPTHDRS